LNPRYEVVDVQEKRETLRDQDTGRLREKKRYERWLRLNRLLASGVILKKDGWLLNIRFNTVARFPTLSIKRLSKSKSNLYFWYRYIISR